MAADREVVDDDPFGGELDGQSRVVAKYEYVDESGAKLYQVRRWEPGHNGKSKSFTQHKWNGKRWVKGIKGVRRVPFRLPELIEAVAAGETIYVCEGEKGVLAMVKAGYAATCNSGGADEWPPEFAGYFDDADVVIIADRDSPGTLHAEKVRANLDGIASSVRVVRSKVDEPKADVVDHLDAGYSIDDLVEVSPAQLTADVIEARRSSSKPAKTRQRAAGGDDEAHEVPTILLTILGLVLANGGKVELPTESGDDYAISCPMHDDEHPSATLNVGDDRPVIFHCFGGCDQDDLYRYLSEDCGINPADLMELRTTGPFDALVEEVRREMAAVDEDMRGDFYSDLLTEDQLAELADPDFVVRNWFERGGYSVIYSPAGVGKTALSSWAAKAVSLGVPWMDSGTQKGAVLFLTGEGMAQIKMRLGALGEKRRGDPILFGGPHDIEEPEGVARIVATVRRMIETHGVPVQLIVIDPLMEFMSSDEVGEGMHKASRGLRALASMTDTAVLVIHHTNGTGEVERGNKVLRQRALGMTKAEKRPSGDVTLIQDKMKNAPEHVFSLLKRPDVNGIAFDLADRWPREEFEELRAEWTETAKANRIAKKQSRDIGPFCCVRG